MGLVQPRSRGSRLHTNSRNQNTITYAHTRFFPPGPVKTPLVLEAAETGRRSSSFLPQGELRVTELTQRGALSRGRESGKALH